MGYRHKFAAASPASPGESEWGYSARRDLLEQITDFLLQHDLDVTPANLETAHAIVSGTDLELARQVCQRQLGGQPITQQWLDARRAECAMHRGEDDRIDAIIEQAIQAVHGFADSARTACQDTGTASTEMRRHVSQAGQTDLPVEPSQFRTLTRAVLGTLERLEANMQRSRDESRELQAQLDKARSEANCDHLTGLPNRRAFEHALLRFRAEAEAARDTLVLAICDVDHFKRINDTFGHETGDRLLRAIAGVLQRFASQDCFVARHGGEEFVILIRGVDADDAFDRLDRARRELAARKFVARRSKRAIGRITLSAGIADVFASDNPRDALAAADNALYEAKETGRNRIVAA